MKNYYPPNDMEDGDLDHAKVQLSAAILNARAEAEIYEWLALTVPEYGTKPFNQAFITWLNKRACERFGTQVYEKWGMNGEDKTVPKVNFYMSRTTYTEQVKFDLSFSYKGSVANYDHPAGGGAKTYEVRERSENEKLYGIESAAKLVEECGRVAGFRRDALPKLQQNMKDLPKLAAERKKVFELVEAYNDKITYAIGDDWRIK